MNVEEQARGMGWVPEEEFKGDPPKHGFKTAQEFIDAEKDILPVVQSKVERIEKELADSKKANLQFGEFFKDYKQREEKEKKGLREELQQVKQQAVTDGDGEAFIKAERELADLDPEPQQMTPVQSGWLQDNKWYGTDENLTVFADGMAERLVGQGYTDQSPAYFEELSKRVKAFSPDQFGNPNRDKPGTVETATEKAASKSKSYESLPPEARKACDSFVKQGFMTQEDYVKTFEWEEENV